jgi:hypothetical protein
VSESNNKLSIEEIVQRVVDTTDDTYDTFLELIEDRDPKIKSRVIEKLSVPFPQLEQTYLTHHLYIEGSKEFRYSEKDFQAVKSKFKANNIQQDEIEYYATVSWIDRKQKDLLKIVMEFNKDYDATHLESLFPTFKHSSKVSIDQIEQIYEVLISDPVFIEDSNRQLFLDCFTKSKLSVQPKIKFLHKPQILYHLFRLLNQYKVIIDQTKSDIFSKNHLFVSDDGSPFKTALRQGLDSLKEYPKDNKQKQLVLHLESSFKSIFDKV